MKRLESILIILVGNELLNGSTKDKNASYLLEKLSLINDLYTEVSIIPDVESKIVQKIRDNITKFDLIVTSGGLGPTTDDLTVQSIASALNQELKQDPDSLLRLVEKLKKRGREINANNLKQTYFPENSTIVPNNYGTADSCISKSSNGCYIFTFPGVPKEFQPLIDGPFFQFLNETFKINHSKSVNHFRTFGLTESHVGTIIESLNLSAEISVAYRPQFPEILVTLKSDNFDSIELETIQSKIINALGPEYVISYEEKQNLPQVVFSLLTNNRKTISFAESCTGGRLSSEITKISGSSKVFLGGIVCYSNEIKTDILKVDPDVISKEGAVSPEVAFFLANNIKSISKSDYAVSITGIAGPDGGSIEKPVGLAYIGLSTNEATQTFKFNLPWDRERNQIYCTWLCLDLLRRSILNLNLNWEQK